MEKFFLSGAKSGWAAYLNMSEIAALMRQLHVLGNLQDLPKVYSMDVGYNGVNLRPASLLILPDLKEEGPTGMVFFTVSIIDDINHEIIDEEFYGIDVMELV